MKCKNFLLTLGLGLCTFSATQGIAAKQALYTPFNWANSSPSGYILKGEFCVILGPLGLVGCGPVTLVNDPPNNRMFLDLGALGGQYWLLNDISYGNNVVPGQPDVCAQVSGFSYHQQVSGYLTALSYATESAPGGLRYMGRVADVASCKDRIATEMFAKTLPFNSVQNQVLSEWNFSALVPFPGLGCPIVGGHMVFDVKHVDFKSNRDSYFNSMPTDKCNASSPNFCDVVFPPGNACEALMP
jgi:hypothetical protein